MQATCLEVGGEGRHQRIKIVYEEGRQVGKQV